VQLLQVLKGGMVMPAIRVELSKELHKSIKLRALQNDMTLQKFVPMVLEAYIAPVVKAAKVTKVSEGKCKRRGSHQTYSLDKVK
jgi:hypothetical protein